MKLTKIGLTPLLYKFFCILIELYSFLAPLLQMLKGHCNKSHCLFLYSW